MNKEEKNVDKKYYQTRAKITTALHEMCNIDRDYLIFRRAVIDLLNEIEENSDDDL